MKHVRQGSFVKNIVWRGILRRGLSIAIAMSMFLSLICGCGKEKEELPSDTPWNNGYNAIMETENGYYTNQQYFQCLRFHEKGTGKEIFLCAKPECQHNGEDYCTATYQDWMTVNSVLYDGKIYILVLGERDGSAGFSLYRAALDGSFIDKVGDVFQERNMTGAECYYSPPTATGEPTPFIIHKGYAYIPFFLSFKWSLAGFRNGGIIRMDLQTGRTEQIYTMEKLSAPYPWNLRGCGDYVYFDLYASGGGMEETLRYHIKDGTVAQPLSQDQVERAGIWLDAVSEKRIYTCHVADEQGRPSVGAYDSETGEWLGILFSVDAPDDSFALIPYQDKFFVCLPEKLMIYSEDGEKQGEMAFRFADDAWFELHGSTYNTDGLLSVGEGKDDYIYSPWNECFSLKISGDKVYAVLADANIMTGALRARYSRFFWPGEIYYVFSCPIADILDGKGRWTNEYNIQSWQALNPERECPKEDTRPMMKRVVTEDEW